MASSSLKAGKLIFIWAPVSLHCLPHWECQEPSNLSDCDDTNEAVNTELLSLLNLQSGEGEGGWGGISLWSLLHWSWFQPLCSLQGDGWWSKLASLGWSLQGESLGWWNLNGCGVDGCKCGCPGPLPSIWHSVTAWVIVHWPSCIVKGSVARYAGLPTQVPAPVSVNAVSLALT